MDTNKKNKFKEKNILSISFAAILLVGMAVLSAGFVSGEGKADDVDKGVTVEETEEVFSDDADADATEEKLTIAELEDKPNERKVPDSGEQLKEENVTKEYFPDDPEGDATEEQ